MAELRCVCRWAQALGGQWTGVQAWPELLLLLSSRVEVGAAWVVFAEVHIEVAAQLSLWFPSRFLSSLSPEATVGMLPPSDLSCALGDSQVLSSLGMPCVFEALFIFILFALSVCFLFS